MTIDQYLQGAKVCHSISIAKSDIGILVSHLETLLHCKTAAYT